MCTPYANCGVLPARLLSVSATWWFKSCKALTATSRMHLHVGILATGERLVNWMKAAVEEASCAEAACPSKSK